MDIQIVMLSMQAVSAAGILAIAIISYFGQSTRDLRREMMAGFDSIRIEIRDMNTRLARVEGYLRLSDPNQRSTTEGK